MTVSIGISQGPQHAMNPRELVACAESAMMAAKARGKNQTVLYDDGATERPAAGATAVARDVRSIAHLKMLQSLAGKLNRLNDVQQIGQTIATELRLLIDYHNCRVVMRDGDQLRPITFVGEYDSSVHSAADAYTSRVGVGITGRVAETGESLLVPNALECEFGFKIPGTQEIEESLALVPLRYGSRVTGVIVISKLGLNQFDDDDVRLLEVLAGQASVALENARLYEQQRREAEGAKALLAFADVVSRAHTVEEICEQMVQTAVSLFETEAASLWLGDTCAASVGPPLTEGTCVPLAEGDGIEGRLVLGLGCARRAPRAAAGIVLVPGLRRPAEGVPVRPAARVGRDRELAARGEPRARDRGDAGGRPGAERRGDGARARHRACRTLDRGGRGARRPRRPCLERVRGGGRSGGAAGASRGSSRTSGSKAAVRPSCSSPTWSPTSTGSRTSRVARFVVAPLRLEGNRVGALTVTIGDRDLDDRQLRLLEGLAHQAKLAIESAENFESLEHTFVSTVASLANALEANDAYTSSHARWISDMSLLVGRRLHLDRDTLKRLELAALFHDIGKIGIPSEILQKPGPLTEEEFEIVKQHPELGEKILAPIDRLADVRPIVRACHERWDGLGYPDGRKGTEIPLEARIVLVCDAFHAMVTDRPYRQHLPDDEAVRRLREAAGTQFDPAVVEAFWRLFEAGEVLPL